MKEQRRSEYQPHAFVCQKEKKPKKHDPRSFIRLFPSGGLLPIPSLNASVAHIFWSNLDVAVKGSVTLAGFQSKG
jgi:hypothetical protein